VQSVHDEGPVADDAAAPPPPPDETTGFGETPPPAGPPPAKSSRKPWIIAVAALLVLVLVGGAVAVILSVTGEDEHSITITSSAGGMKRDKDGEADLKQQLDATAKQFQTQFKGTGIKRALYNQDDTDRGPKGQLLFLGFKFKTPSEKNPDKFVSQLNKIAASNELKVTKVATGDAGGKAVCIGTAADAPQKNSSCLWVTRDTAGALFPSVGGYDSAHLSKIMTDLREDVETTD